MSDDDLVSIAQIVPCTEAEGPGRRFAVWFQGCPFRCPGCCNPEFLSFQGGEQLRLIDLKNAIDRSLAKSSIEGISLLGGEPLAHPEATLSLAEFARARDLSVMIYSGYTLTEIRVLGPIANQILTATDLLVDGRYIREQPEHNRRWIGSANQQLHFLSDFYSPDDPRFGEKNTLEVRMIGSDILINGFPAAGARDLWRGWRRKQVARA
jgi:anaerobic ribonucleoside-triphosphate reductase activating protein